MPISSPTPNIWRTASHSDPTRSMRNDLAALGAHLSACPQLHRHLLTLQRVAVSFHGFMATRFVSTLMILGLLFGLAYWVH